MLMLVYIAPKWTPLYPLTRYLTAGNAILISQPCVMRSRQPLWMSHSAGGCRQAVNHISTVSRCKAAMNAPPFPGGSAVQQGLQAENAAAEPDVHSGGAMAEAGTRDGVHGAHAPENTARRASTSSRAAATLMQMSQELPSSRRVIYDEVHSMACDGTVCRA